MLNISINSFKIDGQNWILKNKKLDWLSFELIVNYFVKRIV